MPPRIDPSPTCSANPNQLARCHRPASAIHFDSSAPSINDVEQARERQHIAGMTATGTHQLQRYKVLNSGTTYGSSCSAPSDESSASSSSSSVSLHMDPLEGKSNISAFPHQNGQPRGHARRATLPPSPPILSSTTVSSTASAQRAAHKTFLRLHRRVSARSAAVALWGPSTFLAGASEQFQDDPAQMRAVEEEYRQPLLNDQLRKEGGAQDEGEEAAKSRREPLARALRHRFLARYPERPVIAPAGDGVAPSAPHIAEVNETPSLSRTPTPVATPARLIPHPMRELQRLGSAAFNDAPLEAFLTSLSLGSSKRTRTADVPRTSTPWVTAAAGGSVRVRRSRPLLGAAAAVTYALAEKDMCTVRLGDVEGRMFRIHATTPTVSPIKDLIDAYDGCLWDGTEFVVWPLVDTNARDSLKPSSAQDRSNEGGQNALDGVISAALSGFTQPRSDSAQGQFLQQQRRTMRLSGTVSCVGVSTIGGAASIAATTQIPEMELHGSFGTRPVLLGREELQHQQQQQPRLEGVAPVSDDPLTATVSMPRLDATTGSIVTNIMADQQYVVERWRRFSTAAALYVALADAGACDTTAFPFLGVRLITWGELVDTCDVRVEMLSCGVESTQQLLCKALADREAKVPVAVMLPIARKGTLRMPPRPHADPVTVGGSKAAHEPFTNLTTAPPSIVTQPFTDAEVFQLFYLQLILRAFFDIRLPGMVFRQQTGSGEQPGYLRTDLIGAHISRRQSLAFEHPIKEDSWLFFPAPSRVLTLLSLDDAVVPMYATPAQLQATARSPLYGAFASTGGSAANIPCLGELGASAIRWAASQDIHSPAAAVTALEGLFALFGNSYGSTRHQVRMCPVPPKVFRCSESRAFAALRAGSPQLSRFFVSSDARRSSLALSQKKVLSTPKGTPYLGPATISRLASTLCASLLATPRTIAMDLGASRTSTVHPIEMLTAAAVTNTNGNTQRRSSQPHPILDIAHTAVFPSDINSAGRAAPGQRVEGVLTPQSRNGSMTSHNLLINTSFPGVGEYFMEKTAAEGERQSFTCEGDLNTEEEAFPLVSNASIFVAPTSPFTMQESLVTRWRHYVEEGLISIFDGVTDGIELLGFLGRGGSGLVYRGLYGRRGLPVAVKVFVIPDGMSHEDYVRESLTDVAFFVLCNQLDDYGICASCRAHDFIVSSTTPRRLDPADADTARRGGDAATTKLCYLVTDLMDGTLGRFLREDEDDYDPCYDTLVNSPLRDGELFQFLFAQLVSKALFDWRVLDLMLSSQLRGDNIGFRHIALPESKRKEMETDPEAAQALLRTRQFYSGILFQFQPSSDAPTQYLRFPVSGVEGEENPLLGSLRFIYFIDLGQGLQPNVAELSKNRLIGETVVESCITDDGFGRYWPLDELYCKYVDVKGKLAEEAVAWGSQLRVKSQGDALEALGQLFSLYYPVYGIEKPTAEELCTHLMLSWGPLIVNELQYAYVYRTE